MASLASISVWVGLFGSLTGLGGAGVLIPIMVLAGIPVKEAIACGVVAITGAVARATVTALIAPAFLYFFFAALLMTSSLGLRIMQADCEPVTTAFVPIVMTMSLTLHQRDRSAMPTRDGLSDATQSDSQPDLPQC